MSLITQRILTALVIMGTAAAAHAALTQKTYSARMRAQLDNLTAKLQTLEKKESQVHPENRDAFRERLKDLWQREKVARVNLEAIKHAPEAQWQALKAKEDAAVISLTKSYRKLVNRYLK